MKTAAGSTHPNHVRLVNDETADLSLLIRFGDVGAVPTTEECFGGEVEQTHLGMAHVQLPLHLWISEKATHTT